MLRQIVIDYLVGKAGLSAEMFTNPELKVSELGLDSLGVIEMLFEIEDRYGFQIEEPQKYAHMTFNQMVDDIESVIRSKNNGELPPINQPPQH